MKNKITKRIQVMEENIKGTSRRLKTDVETRIQRIDFDTVNRYSFILFFFALLFPILGIIVLQSVREEKEISKAATVETYSFGTCTPSTDCWAYEKGGTEPSDPTDYDTGAVTGDYTNISVSDDSRWITELATVDGEYDSQIFEFEISEEESDLTQLDFTWEGYGETAETYETTVYVWDYDSSIWEVIGSVDFTSTVDQSVLFTESTDPGKFINVDKKISMMVKSKKLVDPCEPLSCSCDGTSYETRNCANGDTIYVDCNADKCWAPSVRGYAWGTGTYPSYGCNVTYCTGGGEECPACNYCDTLDYGGQTDWVLPDVTTLQDLCNSDSCHIDGTTLCFDYDGEIGYDAYWTDYSPSIIYGRFVGFAFCTDENQTKGPGTFMSQRCVLPGSSPYIYIYSDNTYTKVSDFIGGATSGEKEYIDYVDITGTSVEENKVRLKITEELDETAYIDHIYLQVDGYKIIDLSGITDADVGLVRESDDEYLVMDKGSAHYIEFVLSESYETLEFVAEGYYIEHDTSQNNNSVHTDYVEVVVTACKSNGDSCDDEAECCSSHCVDTVCCDTLCDGPFEDCNLAGSEGTCSDASVCGNGLVENEECDDGDTDPGDGCSNTCTIEEGWECTGEPSVCSPIVIIYVKYDATGADDGTSWSDAYIDLQDGITDSASGEEVWVARGTYSPGSERSDSYHLKTGVGIYGGFSGIETLRSQRDWHWNETVLDGNDLNYHVVRGDGVDRTAVLDGFTITRGRANAGNNPDAYGGGIYGGSAILRNLIVKNNFAQWGGGGIHTSYSGPLIENCLIINNSGGSWGGGIRTYFGDTDINNITCVGNDALSGGCLHNQQGGNTLITNSIAWGNGGTEEIKDGTAAGPYVAVNYSLVEGGYDGTGNIDSDPLFLSSSNFRLQSSSPAIDAGNNEVIDTLTDLDNIDRFIDAPASDTGNGTPPIIDMGAYEYNDDQTCGNNLIEGNEMCDDGATSGGDGCSQFCQIESGWDCIGEPSICSLQNGEDCTDGGECTSGNCIDDVCCDTTCSGTCEACDLAGTEGTCTNVQDNTDPDNECSISWDSCESSCIKRGSDGYCDGAGACDTDDATENVTADKVCSAGSEVDAGSSTSCDGSVDYYSSAGECTFSRRYAECDGSGVCDTNADVNYQGSIQDVLDGSVAIDQSGGSANPYEAPNSSNYCDYAESCDAGDCSATEYYRACGGSGSCRTDNTGAGTEVINANEGFTLTDSCGISGTTICGSGTWGCNGGCARERDEYRCSAAQSCDYVVGTEGENCAAGTACSGGTCGSGTYCNASWAWCVAAGDNNYDTGGYFDCQGSCDGSNSCDYALNCEEIGDGSIGGNEECDDGNTDDGDGCSSTGQIEDGWECSGEPSSCSEIHGDGQIVGGEECDDGNTDDEDGCSSAGQVEDGWECSGEPSSCSEIHGDGQIVGGEECDDGNTSDGDGCSSAGQIEDGYDCSGEPSECTKQDGELCSSDGECTSGYCRDGYCCNSACSGTCRACDLSGSEGLCKAVEDGEDPDSECNVSWNSCSGKCRKLGGDGTCNGQGECHSDNRQANCDQGTACSGGVCSVSYLCNSTWSASLGSGNNNYAAGGSYQCQGACDGDNNCDYAVNCTGEEVIEEDEEEEELGEGDDKDGDGIDDGWEDNYDCVESDRSDSGEDPDGDGLDNKAEFGNGTDPCVEDTDEDGLSDGDEVNNLSCDPNDKDSDADGILDGEEVEEYGTDPASADTDGDGFDDKTEIDSGTDPNDPSDYPLEELVETGEEEKKGEEKGFSLSPVLIIAAGVGILAISGIAFLFVIFKRKKKEEEEKNTFK